MGPVIKQKASRLCAEYWEQRFSVEEILITCIPMIAQVEVITTTTYIDTHDLDD